MAGNANGSLPAAVGSICTTWRRELQKGQFTPSQDVNQDFLISEEIHLSNCLTGTLYKRLSQVNIDDTALIFSAFNNNWKF